MKSELSLRREYRRIEQSRKALAKPDTFSRDALWGALQAIAWALDQNAMPREPVLADQWQSARATNAHTKGWPMTPEGRREGHEMLAEMRQILDANFTQQAVQFNTLAMWINTLALLLAEAHPQVQEKKGVTDTRVGHLQYQKPLATASDNELGPTVDTREQLRRHIAAIDGRRPQNGHSERGFATCPHPDCVAANASRTAAPDVAEGDRSMTRDHGRNPLAGFTIRSEQALRDVQAIIDSADRLSRRDPGLLWPDTVAAAMPTIRELIADLYDAVRDAGGGNQLPRGLRRRSRSPPYYEW